MLQNVFQPHASLFPDHRRRERHHRLRLARRPRERESIAVRESFPLVLVRARPQIFPPRPHQPVKLQRVRRPRALPSVRLRALRRHRARARHRARRSRRRALHDDVVRAGVRARPPVPTPIPIPPRRRRARVASPVERRARRARERRVDSRRFAIPRPRSRASTPFESPRDAKCRHCVARRFDSRRARTASRPRDARAMTRERRARAARSRGARARETMAAVTLGTFLVLGRAGAFRGASARRAPPQAMDAGRGKRGRDGVAAGAAMDDAPAARSPGDAMHADSEQAGDRRRRRRRRGKAADGIPEGFERGDVRTDG